MKKLIYIIGFLVLTMSCAHRGLNLSDQIPQKFIEEARANTPEGYELIGVVEEGAKLSEQSIIFAGDFAKQKYQRKSGQAFYYQLADSSGNFKQFNASLKKNRNNIRVVKNQLNKIDRIEINGFDFVRVSTPSKDRALLVRSSSTQKFFFKYNFNHEGVLAH